MVYPYMNSTLVGNDLSQILVYANQITGGAVSFWMVITFFLVVFIGSAMWSFRTTGRIKIEVHFAAASFANLGWVILLSSIVGNFMQPYLIMASIGLAIAGGLWLFLSNPTENY